jgi:hypothetical protein
MTPTLVPPWLEWAREIQALSQSGLTYCNSHYDAQRYQRLMEIAAEIVQAHTGLPAEPLLESFSEQTGYATPKVDVRGAVIRDGKILLVQERRDQRWCMPGGWADVGELPSGAVAREVWEESGFHHAYKIVFLCDLLGGEARPDDETMAAGFFPFDGVPALSSERTNELHLNEVAAHLKDSRRPAAFD